MTDLKQIVTHRPPEGEGKFTKRRVAQLERNAAMWARAATSTSAVAAGGNAPPTVSRRARGQLESPCRIAAPTASKLLGFLHRSQIRRPHDFETDKLAAAFASITCLHPARAVVRSGRHRSGRERQGRLARDPCANLGLLADLPAECVLLVIQRGLDRLGDVAPSCETTRGPCGGSADLRDSAWWPALVRSPSLRSSVMCSQCGNSGTKMAVMGITRRRRSRSAEALGDHPIRRLAGIASGRCHRPDQRRHLLCRVRVGRRGVCA